MSNFNDNARNTDFRKESLEQKRMIIHLTSNYCILENIFYQVFFICIFLKYPWKGINVNETESLLFPFFHGRRPGHQQAGAG
jgi:hypothetical protein